MYENAYVNIFTTLDIIKGEKTLRTMAKIVSEKGMITSIIIGRTLGESNHILYYVSIGG
jgi:hypothetical protein